MARAIDGDKLVENLRLIATCWSISPYVSKEKHNGAVDMLREVEREVKNAPILTPPNEPLSVLVNDEPDREYIDYICPRCKDIISQRRRGQRMETVYQCKYHDNCGQRMDWSNPQPYRRPPEAKDNNVPTNEPLTIEELLKMDGEPVYVVFMPDSSGKRSQSWALVNVDKKYGEVYLVDSIPGASCYYDEIWADLEGIYRRPPEGEEDT